MVQIQNFMKTSSALALHVIQVLGQPKLWLFAPEFAILTCLGGLGSSLSCHCTCNRPTQAQGTCWPVPRWEATMVPKDDP